MSNQLKPCRCGNATLEVLESFLDDVHSVRCPKCGAETDEWGTPDAAVDAWNHQMEDGKHGEAAEATLAEQREGVKKQV